MQAPARRALLTGSLIAVLAAGLLYAFWPQPALVDLAPIRRGPLQVTVGDEGWTRVKELFVVSTPVAGRIERVEVKAGDLATGGEPLVLLNPSEPTPLDVRSRAQAEAVVEATQAALSLSEAAAARARAELEFAQADLKRAQKLVRSQAVSERAVELAQLDVKTRQAALATAEADRRVRQFELQRAQAALIDPGAARSFPKPARLCCLPVLSPIDGRVLRVIEESERVLPAGTPIAEVGDLGGLEVLVQLLSTDAVRIAEGSVARIEHWGGDHTLAGRVRRIEPQGFTKISALGVEEQRVNVLIDFTDPPERWRTLGAGYRVEARIIVWEADDVVKIATGALFRDGDAWATFVASGGRAELRHVEIGWMNDLEAELRGGLAPGERVVLHPSDRIRQGARVAERQ